jgi:hypothetical protein
MADTAITRYENTNMQDRVAYANTLAGAADLIPRGLFDRQTGRPSPAKIFLVLETGAMLGLPPMAALQGIDVIEGNATLSPRLMTALVRKAGHKLTVVKKGSIAGGDFSVTVVGERETPQHATATETWDIDRAARAGLCAKTYDERTKVYGVRAESDKGKALPWQLYPEALCLWRAVGWVCRELFADVLMGLAYTPEEMDQDMIAPDGSIDHEAIDAREDEMILLFKGDGAERKPVQDKAEMAVIWQEHHGTEAWTPRVEAEFAAHLSTLTVDTRPVKPQGAPGKTGDARIDEPAEDGPGEEDAVEVTDEDEDVLPDDATEEEIAAWEAREVARARARGELI